MPRLAKFIFKHLVIGIASGWVILAGILWFNLGGLSGLIFASSINYVALGALTALFAITFGPAAVATAVLMGHEFEDEADKDSGARVHVGQMVALPVRAEK